MATEVFSGDVNGTATRYGKDVYAKASESLKPGLLVLLTCGSSASKAGTSDIPVGVAYGARHQVYRPTSKTFADGEELTVLMGDMMNLYSSDFFDGGLPAAGDTLYSYTGGLMKSSGSHVVGRCVTTVTRTEEVGGVGTSQTLALVHLNLHPIAS